MYFGNWLNLLCYNAFDLYGLKGLEFFVVKKSASALLALFALATAFLSMSEFCWYAGFPDGYISDYDRAMQPVVRVGASLLTGVAIYFIYGGWFSGADKRLRHLLIGSGLLVAILTTLYVINALALSQLNYGQGG